MEIHKFSRIIISAVHTNCEHKANDLSWKLHGGVIFLIKALDISLDEFKLTIPIVFIGDKSKYLLLYLHSYLLHNLLLSSSLPGSGRVPATSLCYRTSLIDDTATSKALS